MTGEFPCPELDFDLLTLLPILSLTRKLSITHTVDFDLSLSGEAKMAPPPPPPPPRQ